MKNRKAIGFIAVGLAAGLALGSIGIATAATAVQSSRATTSTATTTDQSTPGPGGPGGRGEMSKHGGFTGVGDISEALADLSGLSVDEIETQRRAGTSYAAIAKAEGVSESDLIAKTVAIEKNELDAAVSDGTITDAQRTSYLSNLEASIKEAIASTDATRGPGGPGGRGGRAGFGGMGDIPEALAELSGLTVTEIQTQREAGTSYADIAKSKGVSSSDLIAATVKIETAELYAAVKAGSMTSAERDSILSSLESNLEEAIASTDALRGPGGPGDPHKSTTQSSSTTNSSTTPQ